MIQWLSTACILFVLDRITKYNALHYFATQDYDFTPFLSGTCVLNRGSSFGFFSSDNNIYFWLLTIIICFINYFLLLAWFKNKHRITCISVGFFLMNTGSLSNIIDRFLYRAVIDWIYVHYRDYSFPVFNFADTYIVLGVFLILYVYMID